MRCPKFKNKKFVRQKNELIEMIDDGEKIIDKILDYRGIEYTCQNFGIKIDEEELVK